MLALEGRTSPALHVSTCYGSLLFPLWISSSWDQSSRLHSMPRPSSSLYTSHTHVYVVFSCKLDLSSFMSNCPPDSSVLHCLCTLTLHTQKKFLTSFLPTANLLQGSKRLIFCSSEASHFIANIIHTILHQNLPVEVISTWIFPTCFYFVTIKLSKYSLPQSVKQLKDFILCPNYSCGSTTYKVYPLWQPTYKLTNSLFI